MGVLIDPQASWLRVLTEVQSMWRSALDSPQDRQRNPSHHASRHGEETWRGDMARRHGKETWQGNMARKHGEEACDEAPTYTHGKWVAMVRPVRHPESW